MNKTAGCASGYRPSIWYSDQAGAGTANHTGPAAAQFSNGGDIGGSIGRHHSGALVNLWGLAAPTGDHGA